MRFSSLLRRMPQHFAYAYRSVNTQTQLKNAGTMASHLKSRSVIRFSGPDTVKFLQGLLTNDVRRFCEPVYEKNAMILTPNMPAVSASPMYAALLTPQGRFLYDLFLYRQSRPEDKLDETGSGPGRDADSGGSVELYADVDASIVDELLQTLKKYRLRSKVEIENLERDFSCWQRYGKNLSEASSSVEEPEAASVGWGGGVDQAGESASRANKYGWQWNKDPRLNCLGYRGIFPSNTLPPLVESDKESDELFYLLWRLEQGVAEGSSEIPKGEAIPLEYNLAGLNAISFDKGCYVGQELIARTHHRGVIRKRLIPMRFLDNNGKEVEERVAPGSEVIHSLSGKKMGSVTTALGFRGMGVLRVEGAFRGPNQLSVKGAEDVKVEAIKPAWWPSDWFHDLHDSAVA